jgi:hypothetical protein
MIYLHRAWMYYSITTKGSTVYQTPQLHAYSHHCMLVNGQSGPGRHNTYKRVCKNRMNWGGFEPVSGSLELKAFSLRQENKVELFFLTAFGDSTGWKSKRLPSPSDSNICCSVSTENRTTSTRTTRSSTTTAAATPTQSVQCNFPIHDWRPGGMRSP